MVGIGFAVEMALWGEAVIFFPVIRRWVTAGCWRLDGKCTLKRVSQQHVDIMLRTYSDSLVTIPIRTRESLSAPWLEKLSYATLQLAVSTPNVRWPHALEVQEGEFEKVGQAQ